MITPKEATKLFQKANVNMVGVGKSKQVVVGVETKMPKSALASKDIVPMFVAGMPTDVIQTGKIYALPKKKSTPTVMRTGRYRPAPGGVSIGHYAITAGTLGMPVMKNGVKMILSNNHVLANSNDADIGDEIRQPGAYDGGTSSDRIGYLHSFKTIVFFGDDDDGDNGCLFSHAFAGMWNAVWKYFGPMILWRKIATQFTTYNSDIYYNFADCALAIPDNGTDLRDDILEIGVPTGFGEVEVGDKVCKSGRTTGYTEGTVQAVNAYVQVGYGGGQLAYFTDQIITTNMLAGGDSGSLLLAEDKKTAVGLCFAGSDEVGIHNRILNVQNALGGFDVIK